MQQPETQVSTNAAWQAARERAIRTTDALIVAEARIVDLEAHVRELEAERSHNAQEYERMKALYQRRIERLSQRAREAVQEVSDAAEDQEQNSDAVSEAVHAHAFSD